MTKKIAFGTTLLDKGLLESGIDGIGQYCQELLHQFSKDSNELEISPYSFGVDKGPSRATLLPAYSGYLAKNLLKIDLHSKANQYFNDVDVVHCTDQLIPIMRNTPLVATVMDTIPLSHPQFIKAHSRFLKPWLWKKLTERADHIITISEFSKGEIIEHMGFLEEKITSIPLGVDARYFERISQIEIQSTLTQFGIDRPFFLYIGSIQPRKNLLRIIKAHAALPHQLATQFPLVMAGKIAWDDGKILAAIQRGVFEKHCIWLNYVSDFEKRCLLQSTLGLVFTSLYEGFGLPILEAFASGASVISSNCTSMPEVAGKAAFLVNPLDTRELTEALNLLIEHPAEVDELKSQGLKKAKLFTWSNVAASTKAVYLNL